MSASASTSKAASAPHSGTRTQTFDTWRSFSATFAARRSVAGRYGVDLPQLPHHARFNGEPTKEEKRTIKMLEVATGMLGPRVLRRNAEAFDFLENANAEKMRARTDQHRTVTKQTTSTSNTFPSASQETSRSATPRASTENSQSPPDANANPNYANANAYSYPYATVTLSPAPAPAQSAASNLTSSPYDYASFFDIPGPSTTHHETHEAEHENPPDTDTEDSTSTDTETETESLSSSFSPFPYVEQYGLMARTTPYAQHHSHALVTAQGQGDTHRHGQNQTRGRSASASNVSPFSPRHSQAPISLRSPYARIPHAPASESGAPLAHQGSLSSHIGASMANRGGRGTGMEMSARSEPGDFGERVSVDNSSSNTSLIGAMGGVNGQNQRQGPGGGANYNIGPYGYRYPAHPPYPSTSTSTSVPTSNSLPTIHSVQPLSSLSSTRNRAYEHPQQRQAPSLPSNPYPPQATKTEPVDIEMDSTEADLGGWARPSDPLPGMQLGYAAPAPAPALSTPYGGYGLGQHGSGSTGVGGSSSAAVGAGFGGYAQSYRHDIGGGGGMGIPYGTSPELSMQYFSSGGGFGTGVGRWGIPDNDQPSRTSISASSITSLPTTSSQQHRLQAGAGFWPTSDLRSEV